MINVKKYGLFELVLDSKENGDIVNYCATFTNEELTIDVPAFKAGNNTYLVRFMPTKIGEWKYKISFSGEIIRGEFFCAKNEESNHGPVSANEYGFCYADEKIYFPFGTTCYAWIHQPKLLQQKTLNTLKQSPFNKIRMCVFPKHMPYNQNEPEIYPFEKTNEGNWDTKQPNEKFWSHLDNIVGQLGSYGIQVDLILFHPYDRWGFSNMGENNDLAYLEYAVARLSAYHNIWWSLANEYDLVVGKNNRDWDAFGELIAKRDVYKHPISIHNCLPIYPKRSWMTHCSIQSGYINEVIKLREQYQMPVIIDECGYEGNIEFDWGNLSAFEMVHRFWWAITRGGYCTHGETFHREDEVLWWAKGGELHGESAERIGFLRQIIESINENMQPTTVFMGFDPNGNNNNDGKSTLPEGFAEALRVMTEDERSRLVLSLLPNKLCSGNHQLIYYGHNCPIHANIELPDAGDYMIEVIDAFQMTRKLYAEKVKGKVKVELTGKEGMAILVSKI